jgi:hypothetical protein|nr:MAG TPA: hypothetical protein [Bacteriophage sp.]DAU46263.1 MAG TPA: hypothetical protein [Bacteriophage sp.]
MNITQTRVKQYNSTYKTVISVDGVPVCITQGNKKASDIVSYLSGYEVEIYDGKLKRQLDKIKSKNGWDIKKILTTPTQIKNRGGKK